MYEVPERGRLTDMLVGYLRQADRVKAFPLVIGDGDPPPEAGWTGGQPQVGDFQASVTLRTGAALPLHREAVRDRHSSWRMRYSLRSIGAVRSQGDAAADVVREAMTHFKGVYFVGFTGRWLVQDAVYEQLGALEKRGSGDQATWEVDDVVELWVVRAPAPRGQVVPPRPTRPAPTEPTEPTPEPVEEPVEEPPADDGFEPSPFE